MTTEREDGRGWIDVAVVVERKQLDLPRFVVVRSSAVATWKLDGTTTLDVEINKTPVDRRTIKRWDDDRWFVTITEKDCHRLGIDTGSPIALRMRIATVELPDEIRRLLSSDARAASAWKRLTPPQQRMLRDAVAAAKQSATRISRARRILLGER